MFLVLCLTVQDGDGEEFQDSPNIVQDIEDIVSWRSFKMLAYGLHLKDSEGRLLASGGSK